MSDSAGVTGTAGAIDGARPRSRDLTARAAMAAEAVRACNWLSRALGRGSGTVAGGRVGLALDPGLLGSLADGRHVALVSGTNGKTTTTRLMVAAWESGSPPVVTNHTGANMPAGHVAALAGAPSGARAVLEVDEGYLGRLVADTSPQVVVLLNLSRDQLDRVSEVRMLVERWREALAAPPGGARAPTVVANADDPLVVRAASVAPDVTWVAAGQVWRHDAVGCPVCEGRIVFGDRDGWVCERCGFARPTPDAWVEGSELVIAGGSRHRLATGLPGPFNRSNAAMAAVAAALTGPGGAPGPDRLGPAVSGALNRMAGIDQVAGRFASAARRGRGVRLLLAKNPAGWAALFDLLDEEGATGSPVVLAVNARVADGLDTSWLWDVPFERLAGRPVVATGDRRLDLAVRLRYAEVACTVVADPLAAVDRAIDAVAGRDEPDRPTADFIGNYTAFADLRARL